MLSEDDPNMTICGKARVSRIDPGHGIAIYFTKIDEHSSARLKQFVIEYNKNIHH